MNVQRLLLFFTTAWLVFSSCRKYLDVVPDNVATIDYAFRQRSTAEQFLFTCYSYMPKHGDVSTNPAFMAGDEIWFYYPYAIPGYTVNVSAWEIARGNQSATSPLVSYWNGTNGASRLYQAIRDCNILLENINRVPGMDQYEKDQWSAEAIFLKAYYHWWLLQLYGPIPIVDKNLPINASQEEVQIERMPVDSCFNYVIRTMENAMTSLPDRIENQSTQMGRITRAIAMAVKARILVTAASPLFNGNTVYPNFVSRSGRPFFNQSFDQQKWVKAAEACRAAIDICSGQGHRLNRFNPSVSYNLPAELQTVMDLRTAITDNFNSEVVWGNTNSMANQIQNMAQPRMNAANGLNLSFWGISAVPLKIVNMFYTKNGVPATEDKTLDFPARGASTRTATAANKYYIQPDYTTAAINFDREPRFYADLGFDGSILFGQGNQDVNALNHLEARQGQYSGWAGTPNNYNITGYWPVKLVNYLNVMPSTTTYSITPYAWPVIRMADLYLLYAECLNEVNGPSAEAYRWIDSVRTRAGIPTVAQAWSTYSTNPAAYTSKEGLRQIIHRERLIEMAFEGQRFWDLRRWKEAERTWLEPIQGWNISQSDVVGYYQVTTLFNRTFRLRDYFWPIAENDLLVNKNLVQNPGW
jgi:hypothetical protein